MDLPADLRASNQAGIDFLITELTLAHTFLDVGETTSLSEHRLQSHEDTQKAYRAVLHLLPRLQLSRQQKLDFDQQLAKLRERMLLAGIEL